MKGEKIVFSIWNTIELPPKNSELFPNMYEFDH